MANSYIVILLTIWLVGGSVGEDMKTIVNNLVAEFKDRMCYQQDDLHLPRLHPLTIDRLPFNISMELAHLKGYLRDFVVQGLGEFKLIEEELSVSLLGGIKIAMKFPEIKIDGYLKAEGDIQAPIDGPGGDIHVTIEDLYINLQIKPVFGGKYIPLEISGLAVTMSKFNAVLKGLSQYPDVDHFFSSVASQLTSVILKESLEDPKTAATIKKTLSDMLNDKLPKLSLMELGSILLGKTNPFKPFPVGKKCSQIRKPKVYLVTKA